MISTKKYFIYKLFIPVFFLFRSLNDGECSADWYNFQESVAHLQLLEEEVRHSFRPSISVFDRFRSLKYTPSALVSLPILAILRLWAQFDFLWILLWTLGTPFIQEENEIRNIFFCVHICILTLLSRAEVEGMAY